MAIDQLRKYCLSLPAVTEDVKWENNLVFSVGGNGKNLSKKVMN